MKQVTLYTDGSCLGNPGPGGWCALLEYCDSRGASHERQLQGSEAGTTNNRMEIQAVIAGLEALQEPCQIAIYSDSSYMRNGITDWIHRWKSNNWRTAAKKPVKNRDLWERLDQLQQMHRIEWHWVRGHSGNERNERCDRVAREQAEQVRAEHLA